jgi:hypothetical protein
MWFASRVRDMNLMWDPAWDLPAPALAHTRGWDRARS